MVSESLLSEKTAISNIFEAQKLNQYAVARTTAADRIKKLKALLKAVTVTYREDIQKAMYDDYKKPKADVDLSEIFAVSAEIKHTISHLRNWMAKQAVDTPLAFFGSSSHIIYQPKGVCLIISPWNFPVNLTLGPLVSAIAAGNTVMIKPSEHTPHTSAVMKAIVDAVFEENEVALIEGDVSTSQALLELPFNHIFFTGAPEIGKVVMAAAAKNLTSVTLELGGKSPTIIDETASISSAAKLIAWGKFFNSGQICIAPDYLLVHESKKAALVTALKQNLDAMYSQSPLESPHISNMVNERHTARVMGYLQDSLDKGAKILHGGNAIKSKIEPTLVDNVNLDSGLMQNEIFGPILPILTYKTTEEVINFINQGEKPLALYIYSKSQKNIDNIMANTRAGGTCINNNDLHFLNINLPFGGANNSGMGRAHGIFGFQAFSEPRAVYRQHIPSALELLMPPYNGFKEKMIALIVKWL